MNDVHVYSLYSGSTGNAFLIVAGGTRFLIDAGKNAKALCAALARCGVDPDSLCAIFLTHEHGDHIKALPVFLKKHPLPVHLAAACAVPLEADPVVSPLLRPHPPVHTEVLPGGITVTSFPTPHDSRASVGYRIEIPFESGFFRVGYATDIGIVTPAVETGLCGCQAVVLESNHDPEMLVCGPYPEVLKERISSRWGHLSNPDCAVFAAKLCASGTRSLMLAHLSETNNTPECARGEVEMTLGTDAVHLCVADPQEVVEMDLGGCLPGEDLGLCPNNSKNFQ